MHMSRFRKAMLVCGVIVSAYLLLYLGLSLYWEEQRIVLVLVDEAGTHKIAKINSWELLPDDNFLTDGSISGMTGTLVEYSALRHRKLFESEIIDGKQNGVARQWDDHGRLKSVSVYSNGMPEGICLWYHPNGQTRQETEYRNGGTIEITRCWYEDGCLGSSYCSSNGMLVGHSQMWDHYGKLIEDVWYGENMIQTSGFACVSWDGKRDSPPVIYDVVGKTNIVYRH